MLSYGQIVKTSYVVTLKNPLLWLFGLFVVGGFNLNFLYFQDIPFRILQGQISLQEIMRYFESHPGHLAALSVLAIFVALGALVLVNWCRVMLVLATKEALDNKPLAAGQQLKKSPKFLPAVIKVSLLTSLLMLVVTAGLLGAPFWLVRDPSSQSLLWTMGVVCLVPLAFTISSINIFTTFFIILLGQPFGKAVNLGTDLFIANWAKILGLSAVLMVIYSASFAIGLALFYIIKILGNFMLALGGQFGFFHFSAMMLVSKGLTGILLWVLLAGLNVFFNTALLLLFLQLTTPIDSEEEKEKKIIISPASSSV